MKKKLKNTLVAVAAILILSGGTFTVNAMTDNSIVNSVKNVFGTEKKVEFEFFNNSEENIKIEDNNDELTVDFE